jgi:hypothetical protein
VGLEALLEQSGLSCHTGRGSRPLVRPHNIIGKLGDSATRIGSGTHTTGEVVPFGRSSERDPRGDGSAATKFDPELHGASSWVTIGPQAKSSKAFRHVSPLMTNVESPPVGRARPRITWVKCGLAQLMGTIPFSYPPHGSDAAQAQDLQDRAASPDRVSHISQAEPDGE